jgi:CubicO group peptidase (beta-lactamase class C family)
MPNPRLTFPWLVLGMFIVAAPASSRAADVPGGEAIWPTQQWQTSTPEAQGMDSAALAKLLDFGTSRSFDSLLIARHGRIVLDAYYAPYRADIPHIINSSTKAVMGTLTAIAVKDGLLDSLNHPMLDFFPGRDIANLDDRKKAITVQSLLDMTSGIDWKEPIDGSRPDTLFEYERSPDPIKFVLDRPMSHAPGELFNYNSGNPHLLSAIITRLSGMSARDYAKARLFDPLGIGLSNWRNDAQGITIGGGLLFLRPRDTAKIGHLYLRHGEWDGKQLLPTDWIDKVSHPTVNMNASFDPNLRYANFFWALPDKHVTMMVGDRCQVTMIFPELDIVAVISSRNYCAFGHLADLISGAVKSGAAVAPDPAGVDLLAGKIKDISTEKPTKIGAVPETAAAISGKTYRFPGNDLNVKSISLSLTGPQPHYQLEIYSEYQSNASLGFAGPIGLDGLYRLGEQSPLGIIALKGTWLNDREFAMDLRLVGGDRDRRWILSVGGERPNLRGKSWDGRDVAVDGEGGG